MPPAFQSALPEFEPPPQVRSFLAAITEACNRDSQALTSIVLFGSAAKGGFTQQVSDVDLILVLPDSDSENRERVKEVICHLEVQHGFRAPHGPRNFLQAFAERMGNGLSSFVCVRSDLVSGNVARVFSLSPAEAFFVDRIVLSNVIASSMTVCGEDLLSFVHLPPVRRLDVLKAWFSLTNQVIMSLLLYPLLSDATRYAMGALKRSLHSCYFCYHLNTDTLSKEVSFFQKRLRGSQTLERLLELRVNYRNSFRFVLGCLPTMLRLHLHSALDNFFPLNARS